MTGGVTAARAAVERLRRIGGTELAARMIELYLAEAPARVSAVEAGAAGGSADSVARAAHALRSSAGNLGMAVLQQVAQAVESSAAAGVVEHEDVLRLRTEYDASEAALRQVLEELRP